MSAERLTDYRQQLQRKYLSAHTTSTKQCEGWELRGGGREVAPCTKAPSKCHEVRLRLHSRVRNADEVSFVPRVQPFAGARAYP